MAIIATVRCRRMESSIAFYTKVLDFQCIEHGGDCDPSCSALLRGGSLLLLSSHGGDGTFGQAIQQVASPVGPCCIDDFIERLNPFGGFLGIEIVWSFYSGFQHEGGYQY